MPTNTNCRRKNGREKWDWRE